MCIRDSGELARAASIPADVSLRESALPAQLDLPLHLADAIGEALRSSRADLVAVLMAQHEGEVVDADGAPLSDAAAAVSALHTEAQGRLRVLAARVTDETTTDVGLVSWVLLADDWHALCPHQRDDESRILVRRTSPADLAAELAPVLAQVTP